MIRLVIADDHNVLRQALGEMLVAKGNYEVLGEASNGEELLALLKEKHPDVVILDLTMPKLDGLKALAQLKESQGGDPSPAVLVLSADEGEKTVKAALQAGARGFVPKHAGIQELEFAIDSILRGNTYLSPSVTASLVQNGNVAANAESPLSVLTKREVEILTHLADGKPNREIGKFLHISTRTVDTHRSNILKKLNVKTNAELVKLAIQQGLITV